MSPFHSADQKERDYPGKEVEVKQQAMFSLKLVLLKCLEKVVNISWIWLIQQKNRYFISQKYKHRRS